MLFNWKVHVLYPQLKKYLSNNPALPKENLIENNVFVRVNTLIDGNREWLDFKKSNIEFTSDPGFKNWEKHDFTLKESSEIFKKLPEFKDIPFVSL